MTIDTHKNVQNWKKYIIKKQLGNTARFQEINDRSAKKKNSHVTNLDVTAKIAGDREMAYSVCMEGLEENADLSVSLFISRYVILLCIG